MIASNLLERSRRLVAWRLPAAWYRRLTLATAVSVWFLIVLGGSVRVTDSGTGCGSSWPMCDGHLFPALEYHQLVEWNHRLFAILVGLLMATTVGSTLVWYRRPRLFFRLALLAGVTYLTQALLGGITVLMHLDHTWVAAHMGNSMVLLGSVTLLALFSRQSSVVSRQSPVYTSHNQQPITSNQQPVLSRFTLHISLKWLSVVTLVWTFVAMLTGSAVVGAEADTACPAWPQCADTHILPVTGIEWINFGHRVAVGFSDVLMLVLAILIWRTRQNNRPLTRTAHILAALYVSQVFLGAFTVWLNAPAELRGAHLALAAATWAVLVILTALAWRAGVGDRGSGTGHREYEVARDGLSPQSSVVYSVSERGSAGNAGVILSGSEGSASLAQSLPFGGRFAAASDPSLPLKMTSLAGSLRVYFSLMKPRVLPLLLVPTVAAMLMAAVQHPTQRSLIWLILATMLGGTLAAGGAHAINQYWDRDIDARMKRTKRRPVVTGVVPPRSALRFGIALSVLSFVWLWATVNLPAALLAIAGNLFYVFVYTIWLKRTSTQNIVIGGAAGAVPPLVGWAAVTGQVGLPALLFFAIIFFWTPAHFWALALVRQEDYRSAGVPMLPVARGEVYTRWNIALYAALLLAVSLVPVVIGSLSWVYLAAAAGLGVLFVARSLQLVRAASIARAWHLFKFSNIYLALLYLAMVVDRVLALMWRHGA